MQAGSHTITPVLENPYFNITPSSLTVDFPTDAAPYNQDFCITADGTHFDLEVTLIPITRARPGFETTYKLVCKNVGNTTLPGFVSLEFRDDVMSLQSSIPAATVNGGSLSWELNDLSPFESRTIDLTFVLNTPLEDPALNGGDTLVFEANIDSRVAPDETPQNNSFKLVQAVVNSFDPNDKTCLEGNTITEELIGEYVHYLIRFENLGTAEAVNVVVKDTIDLSKFDLSSLVTTDASHSFVTRIRNENNVDFIFENINLPFDDATNDGYVAFKIKTLPTLQIGDVFENQAEIYFDFNAAIITNKYETKIGQKVTGFNDIDFDNTNIQFYPNPVNDKLSISSNEEVKTIEFYSISGSLIKQVSIVGNQKELNLDVASLEQGVYLVKVKTEIDTYLKKIVVD